MLDQQSTPPWPDPERPADRPAPSATPPAPIDQEAAGTRATRPSSAPSLNTRLTSLVEVLLCSGFPTQILITLVLAAAGVGIFASDGRLSLRHIVWLSLIDTALITALVVVFLRARGEGAARVVLGWRRPIGEAGVGLALLPVAFAVVIAAGLAIERFAPWLRNPDGNPLADLLKSPTDIAIFAGVAILAGGFREELQRAFVLHRFEQHLGGAATGLVIFSLAFGLGHALQGWDASVLTALLGFFWGAVYLWRRSMVAPAVCHALFNLIEVLYHGWAA